MDTPDLNALLTPANGMFLGAVVAVTTTIKQVLKGFFVSSLVGQRLLPLVPLVVGVGLALAGLSTGATPQQKILEGLIAGALAGQSFKIGKTTVMGKGLDAPASESEAKEG